VHSTKLYEEVAKKLHYPLSNGRDKAVSGCTYMPMTRSCQAFLRLIFRAMFY
jgi:hypothetical protein